MGITGELLQIGLLPALIGTGTYLSPDAVHTLVNKRTALYFGASLSFLRSPRLRQTYAANDHSPENL